MVGDLVSDVDFVTALCSQVVYEGLVDDTFRIKCGKWRPARWRWCSAAGASCGGQGWWESPRLGANCCLPDSSGTLNGSSGKGSTGKASLEVLIAPPSALKGSVDFGPEVTSSDRSLKVLLNAEDKVRGWVLAVGLRGPWAPALGGEAEPVGEDSPPGASSAQSTELAFDVHLGDGLSVLRDFARTAGCCSHAFLTPPGGRTGRLGASLS